MRLTGIDNADPDTAGIAWAINDLLDLVETFMREADNRFAASTAGSHGEQIDPRGFRGSFSDAIAKLNRNLLDGDAMRDKERRQAAQMQDLSQQVAAIATTTANGSQESCATNV